MKKYFISFALIAGMISTSVAQTNSLNIDTLKSTTITYQNVKTETIDVCGVKFVYRKLGSDGNGIPVVFINHLAGVLDDWDPGRDE
ncbi:hypothetical protein [Terrimonas alba]|uniref:hypothetical protein n=1 Tax=Terrimonas alba TaxID=3349636 RepID=UPI0035F35F65